MVGQVLHRVLRVPHSVQLHMNEWFGLAIASLILTRMEPSDLREFMHEASPGQNMRYSRQHERPYNVGCSTCQCVMVVLSLWLLITLFFCGVPSLFEEGVGDSWIWYANSLFQTLHPVSYAFSVFECFHCSRLAFAVAVACCVAARSRAFHCHAGVASSCCRRPTASG